MDLIIKLNDTDDSRFFLLSSVLCAAWLFPVSFCCWAYFDVGWLFQTQVRCKSPCCFVTDAARSWWTRYSLFAIFLCFVAPYKSPCCLVTDSAQVLLAVTSLDFPVVPFCSGYLLWCGRMSFAHWSLVNIFSEIWEISYFVIFWFDFSAIFFSASFCLLVFCTLSRQLTKFCWCSKIFFLMLQFFEFFPRSSS